MDMIIVLIFITTAQLDISTPVVTCGEVTVQFMANGDTQCQLDSGSFIDCTSPYHHSGLGGGQHVITVRISDGQGGYKHESVSFHISGKTFTYSISYGSFQCSAVTAIIFLVTQIQFNFTSILHWLLITRFSYISPVQLLPNVD